MNDFQLFFHLGWEHILNKSSYDHILFLWALILIYKLSQWRKLLLLISLFTLAHTGSLLLSVYGVIKVDENLIETLILYTIIITAISNILLGTSPLNHRLHYYFSFIFGLIHGLGFAKDFKIMIAGQTEKLRALFSFAIGIELAQVLLGVFILSSVYMITRFFKLTQKEIVLLLSGAILGFVGALFYT